MSCLLTGGPAHVIALLRVDSEAPAAAVEAEESAHGRTIDERDKLEDQIEKAAVELGCEEEWSNLHDHGECVLELAAQARADLDEAVRLLINASPGPSEPEAWQRDRNALYDKLNAREAARHPMPSTPTTTEET